MHWIKDDENIKKLPSTDKNRIIKPIEYRRKLVDTEVCKFRWTLITSTSSASMYEAVKIFNAHSAPDITAINGVTIFLVDGVGG